jgi:hypothetical protein
MCPVRIWAQTATDDDCKVNTEAVSPDIMGLATILNCIHYYFMTNILFNSPRSTLRCFFLSIKWLHPSHVLNKATDSPFTMFSYSLTTNLVTVKRCEEQASLNKLQISREWQAGGSMFLPPLRATRCQYPEHKSMHIPVWRIPPCCIMGLGFYVGLNAEKCICYMTPRITCNTKRKLPQRFRPSGSWSFVVARTKPDTQGTTSGTDHAMTKTHMPVDLNYQQALCSNFKCPKSWLQGQPNGNITYLEEDL